MPHRLVLIEWLDSMGSRSGWHPVSEELEDKAGLIRSVGYLIVDGEHCKRLAGTHHDADDDLGVVESVTGLITIPTVSVVRMVDLIEDAPRKKIRWEDGVVSTERAVDADAAIARGAAVLYVPKPRLKPEAIKAALAKLKRSRKAAPPVQATP